MEYEIDDFYVGPPLRDSRDIENLNEFLNDWLSDERKFMLVEIEECDG